MPQERYHSKCGGRVEGLGVCSKCGATIGTADWAKSQQQIADGYQQTVEDFGRVEEGDSQCLKTCKSIWFMKPWKAGIIIFIFMVCLAIIGGAISSAF